MPQGWNSRFKEIVGQCIFYYHLIQCRVIFWRPYYGHNIKTSNFHFSKWRYLTMKYKYSDHSRQIFNEKWISTAFLSNWISRTYRLPYFSGRNDINYILFILWGPIFFRLISLLCAWLHAGLDQVGVKSLDPSSVWLSVAAGTQLLPLTSRAEDYSRVLEERAWSHPVLEAFAYHGILQLEWNISILFV